MKFVKNRNRHSGLKNFKIITATHSRKPWLHFFCSHAHDRVVVVPRRNDLTLVSFASWLLHVNKNLAAQLRRSETRGPVERETHFRSVFQETWLLSSRWRINMVGPQEEIRFLLRYEIMYFLLFYFFVLILGNFGGLRFRVFGVLGSLF